MTKEVVYMLSKCFRAYMTSLMCFGGQTSKNVRDIQKLDLSVLVCLVRLGMLYILFDA